METYQTIIVTAVFLFAIIGFVGSIMYLCYCFKDKDDYERLWKEAGLSTLDLKPMEYYRICSISKNNDEAERIYHDAIVRILKESNNNPLDFYKEQQAGIGLRKYCIDQLIHTYNSPSALNREIYLCSDKMYRYIMTGNTSDNKNKED